MSLIDLKKQGIDLQENIPLSRYTFTKTGGRADFLAFPKNIEELKQLVVNAKSERMPLTVIGNASNLIIRDGGIRGLVVILTKLSAIKIKENCIQADAGARIIDTAFAAGTHGLSGLEFAAGIPGSIGGAVFMNAGAYGGEIKDTLTQVHVLTRDGQFKTYDQKGMAFSYRYSYVQKTDDIVLDATFALKPDDRLKIVDDMNYLNALRAYKQPLDYPSCGSVFKRPKGHYVGPMIIKAGLQGKRIGDAENSLKHAGFIVNMGHATATDYLDLIHFIQKTIKQKYQIDLQTEVRIIGEAPNTKNE